MSTNFIECVAFTLQAEGGFVNNPTDPGGATMEGVTLATYRNFCHDQNLTVSDLKAITSKEVDAIYQQSYWNANNCDALPPGIDLVVFDFDVNAGNNRSAKILQATLGVSIDGIIGPHTTLVAHCTDPVKLINMLIAHQVSFYKTLKTFPTFGRGWVSRCEARQAVALGMVDVAPVSAQRLIASDKEPVDFYTKLQQV